MPIDWTKLNPFKSNPITAVADGVGKVADAADGIVASASKQVQASKRHNTDMLSDSKLSKAIRPVVLIWAMLLFTGMAVMNYFGKSVDQSYQSTINLILGLAVGFYFPGRTLEKFFKKK